MSIYRCHRVKEEPALNSLLLTLIALALALGLILRRDALLVRYRTPKPDWTHWPQHRTFILAMPWIGVAVLSFPLAMLAASLPDKPEDKIGVMVGAVLGALAAGIHLARFNKTKILPDLDRRYRLRNFQ